MFAQGFASFGAGKISAGSQQLDPLAHFKLPHLPCDLEPAGGTREHFGQLQLPRMKIQPVNLTRHHLCRKNADLQLVLLAQAFGQGRAYFPP